MNKYLAVMWLGPGDERGVLVQAKSSTEVEHLVLSRRWKGKLVQVVRIVEPGNPIFEHVTNQTKLRIAK